MRLLLDTHTLLWWFAGNTALTTRARDAIADVNNKVFVSAASAWEITTKFRIGRVPGIEPIIRDLPMALIGQGFDSLSITMRHAQLAGSLPEPHRDPFDRMLMAQAILEDLVLISNEVVFDAYGAVRLW
jgi:PIN domain nuclease of toxin-antitoxin system